MKLTEKELNYILSECVQQMISENEIDEDISSKYSPDVNTKIRTNLVGGKGWGIGNKLQQTGKAVADGIKNGNGFFGKTLGGIKGATQQVPGLTSIAGGVATGMMFPTASLPFLLAMFGLGQLVNSINRFRQLATKKIPNNKNAAFKIALRALPEYQNSSKLCQTIQSNFNLSCRVYEQVATEEDWNEKQISWNSIKDEIENNEFTLTNGDLKGIRGVTNINQDFSKQDVNESITAPDMQQKQTASTIKKYLSRFNEEGGREFIKKVGELYANAYHLYFKWKSYLRSIMMKFNISWEEIQNGKLNGNSIINSFTYKSDNNIDKESLSTNYITISYLTNTVYKSPENNKDYHYMIWVDNENLQYYAIYQSNNPIDINQDYRFIYNSHISNNKMLPFINPINNKRYKALVLNDNIFDTLEEVQHAQPTTQPTTQPEPGQSDAGVVYVD